MRGYELLIDYLLELEVSPAKHIPQCEIPQLQSQVLIDELDSR